MHSTTVILAVIIATVAPARGAAQRLLPLADATAAGIAAETDGARPVQALVWSLLGTALPIAAGVAVAARTDAGADNATGRTALAAGLVWGGALMGPALGYFRGGLAVRGWQGFGMRAGLFALAWSFAPSMGSDEGTVPDPDVDNMAVWVVASLFIAASNVYDVATVHRSVRAPSRVSFGLVAPAGAVRPGLGLRITF